MKLTSREWHSVIVGKHNLTAFAEQNGSVFRPIRKDDRSFGMWFESRVKYFRRDVQSADEVSAYFSDKWKPSARFRSGRPTFSYPVFIRRLEAVRSYYLVASPFAGLLEELTAKIVDLGGEPCFLRPQIGAFYSATSAPPPDRPISELPSTYWRLILTGARLRIRSSLGMLDKLRQVRSMALSAPELRHSELFKQLVEAPDYARIFELDPSLLRVHYVSQSSLSLAFRMDEHGNFHFRTGADGEYLVAFDQLIAHAGTKDSLFTEGDVYPWRRKTHDILSPVTPSS